MAWSLERRHWDVVDIVKLMEEKNCLIQGLRIGPPYVSYRCGRAGRWCAGVIH
jgi:hypothetical protein